MFHLISLSRGFSKFFWVKYSIFLDKLSLQISFCFYDFSGLWRGLKNSRSPQMCYIKILPKPQCTNAFREGSLEPDRVQTSSIFSCIISPSSSVKPQFSHLYIGGNNSYWEHYWGCWGRPWLAECLAKTGILEDAEPISATLLLAASLHLSATGRGILDPEAS